MGWSRRRLLTVGAGVALAGCNDGTVERNDDYETVTPASVPNETEDLLAELYGLSVPAVDSLDPVEAGHLEAAVDQFVGVLEEIDVALEAIDGDRIVESVEDPEQFLANGRQRARTLREYEPTERALSRTTRELRRAARIAGYAGAAAETIDRTGLEEKLRAVTDAVESFPTETDYQLQQPTDVSLGTIARAEEALPSSIGEPTDGEWPEAAARIRRSIAIGRRAYDDAVRFRDAATDHSVQSSERAVRSIAIGALKEAAARAPDDADEEPPNPGNDPTAQIRYVLAATERNGASVVDDARERIGTQPARSLLELLEWLARYDGIAAAAESVLSGADPTPESLLDAKRDAVDAVDRLAGSDYVARQTGRIAPNAIRSGDEAATSTTNGASYALFAYRAGELVADKGRNRAAWVTRRIEAQQS